MKINDCFNVVDSFCILLMRSLYYPPSHRRLIGMHADRSSGMLSAVSGGPANQNNPAPESMVNLLVLLFREFLNICLFRKGPQDLPASALLLAITVLASMLGSVIVARSSLAWSEALQSAVAETGFMAGVIYALLKLQGMGRRWLQTVTAVAGTNVILVLISLPLLGWLLHTQTGERDSTLPALLFLALIVWNVAILGHIFRHALSTVFPLGILVAIGYYSLSIVFLSWLVPAPAGA